MYENVVGIICAVESEKEEILNRYSEYIIKTVYDLHFYIFNIKSIKVVMVKCGVGKINAARATQILIDKFNVKSVINYGTAGSIDESLNISDIVIAKACVQADADCTVLGITKGKFEEEDELYITADTEYLSIIKEKLEKKGCKVLLENIATFDQFIVDTEFNNNLRKDFNVVCADMESVAIAIVCKACNIPFAIIRGISNVLGEEKPIDSYNKFKNTISSSCVEIISNIID